MGKYQNATHRMGSHSQAIPFSPRRCHFEQLEHRQLLAADLIIDAAEVPLGLPGGQTASISGGVFLPGTATCQGPHSSSGAANIRVQLLSSDGNVLEESFTDEQGKYHFVDLLPGEYAVRKIVSHGFQDQVPAPINSASATSSDQDLNKNIVGEIILQAGASLDGYNFCEDFTEPNRVGGLSSSTLAPIFSLSLIQPPANQQTEIFVQPFRPVATSANLPLSPLSLPRQTDSYGGGNLVFQTTEGVKAWEDSLLDEWFSTLSFVEIANANLPTLSELKPFANEPTDNNDAAFVDGYTADGYTIGSLDWLDGHEQASLHELPSNVQISSIQIAEQADHQEPTAEVASSNTANAKVTTPKVASRKEPQLSQ